MPEQEKEKGDVMKEVFMGLVLCLVVHSCSPVHIVERGTSKRPNALVQAGEPIAVMPFETESVWSNLGSQLSDELVVNLLEHAPHLTIVPGSMVKNYLLNSNLTVSGLPDPHAIHDLQRGVRCRYLLTGNLYTSIGDIRYTSTYSARLAKGSLTLRLIDCDSLTVVWGSHVEGSYATTLYYIEKDAPTSYRTDGELLIELIRDMAARAAKNFY